MAEFNMSNPDVSRIITTFQKHSRWMQGFELVAQHPNAVLLLANAYLELVVNELVKSHCKKAKAILLDHRTYSYSVRLTLLHELGVLSANQFLVLKSVNSLRNKLAHDAFQTVELLEIPEHIMEYAGVRTSVYDVMNNVLGTITNDHRCDLSEFFTGKKGE